MVQRGKVLEIAPAPHWTGGVSIAQLMRQVLLALVPVTLFALYAFGLAALLVLLTAVLSCVLSEHVLCRLTGRPSRVGDGSVAVTGLIYGLTLPPGLPLWMVVVGGVIAVALGKVLFGGLGTNPFNPALVGRAFLQTAFPAAMTSWLPAFAPGRFASLPASTLTFPFARPHYDALSEATPLAALKFEGRATDLPDLLLGFTSGSTGETCALLLLAGGAYLIARRLMSWYIPAGMLGAVAVFSAILHALDPAYPGPGFMLFSGGLMLGALFMATDPVASPLTARGCLIYGALIGCLVVVIRLWSGLPEGIMYAILLGNAVAPHIDRLVQPIPYGARKRGSRP